MFWTGKQEQKKKEQKRKKDEKTIREGQEINHKERKGMHEKFILQ